MHSKTIINKCMAGIYYLIIILAIFACTIRLCTPLLAKYRLEIQQYLSSKLHNDVQIGSFNSSWYGAEPVIKLNSVTVRTVGSHKKVFSIKSISIGINLWRSLSTFSIQPGVFLLNGAELQVFKNKNNQFQIRGIERFQIDQHTDSEASEVIPQSVIDWLINQNELRISNVSLQFKTNNALINTYFSSLKLVKEGEAHKFEGLIKVNNFSKTHLRLVGHWQGSNLDTISGKFYTSIQNIPLEFVNQIMPKNELIIKSGNGNFNIWGEIKPNLLVSIQANIRLSEIFLQNNQTGKTNNIKFLKSALSFNYQKNKSRIFFKNLEFSPYVKFNKEHSFLWEIKGGRSLLQASYVNLTTVKEWLNFLYPRYADRLKSHHVHGTLKNVQLHLINKKPVLFFGKFINIGIHGQNNNSFRNLSGDVYIDRRQGYLNLNSKNTSVSLEKPYEKSIVFNKLNGIYRWTKISDFWRIVSDQSYISMDNLSLSPKFLLDWKGDFKKSYLSLMLGISGQRIEELKPYLPQKGMSQKLRQWFNHSINSIPSLTGHVLIKGKLGDIPFDKGDGTLQATFYAENATMKYHPKWPLATNIDARLFFDKRIMLATINQALIENNKVSNLSVVIKPLGSNRQLLLLTLKDSLESQAVVNFALNSPLKDKLTILSSMAFFKKLDLNLNLTIPLYETNQDNPLLGSINFNANSITLFPNNSLQLTSLSGPLLFNEQGIVHSEMSAKLLSYPLIFSISNQLSVPKGVKFLTKGSMSVDKLKFQWPFLPLSSVTGFFDYNATLLFLKGKDQALIELNSNLLHVQNNMPQPFMKKKDNYQPLRLQANVSSKGFLLGLLLEDKLVSRFKFNQYKKTYQLEKGRVSFKKSKTTLPKENILLFDGFIDKADTKDWYQWFLDNTNETKLSDLIPVHLDFLFRKINVYGQAYKSLNFQLYPYGNGQLLKLNSERIKGKVYFPQQITKKEIDIDLDYLYYLKNDRYKNDGFKSLVNLPSLNVKVRNFIYNTYALGELKFKSKMRHNVLILDTFSLVSKTSLLKFAGQWQFNKNKSDLLFEGFWQSDSLDKVLEQWGIDPVIESKKALITFKLKTDKSLMDISLKDFYGKMSLKLTRGRITHLSREVEKSLGLGKLISILSLQTLPRRLSLDFSDLSHDGFSFDVLKGDFNLNNGALTTSNSFLDGPVSFVSMKGGLNIVKRNYNLTLKIVPHITASLPVVATIAGGPLAGIAAWVASKIINQGIRKVNSYTYKILGPWQQPVVHQVSIKKSNKIIK